MMVLQQHALGAESRQSSGVTFTAEVPRFSPAPSTPPASPTQSDKTDTYISSIKQFVTNGDRKDSFLKYALNKETFNYPSIRSARSHSVEDMETERNIPERDAHSADINKASKRFESSSPVTAAGRKMYPQDDSEFKITSATSPRSNNRHTPSPQPTVLREPSATKLSRVIYKQVPAISDYVPQRSHSFDKKPLSESEIRKVENMSPVNVDDNMEKDAESETEAPLDLSVSTTKEDKFFRHPREISVRDFAREAAHANEDKDEIILDARVAIREPRDFIARYSRELMRDPRELLLRESKDYMIRDPRDFVARDPREFMGVPGEFRDPREFVRHPSDSGTESDDSGGRLSPSDDPQKGGKAYKKSLMKRYCKCTNTFHFECLLSYHSCILSRNTISAVDTIFCLRVNFIEQEFSIVDISY